MGICKGSDSGRDSAVELRDVFSQFTRYGASVETYELMDMLWVLTRINDDLANDRSIECVR